MVGAEAFQSQYYPCLATCDATILPPAAIMVMQANIDANHINQFEKRSKCTNMLKQSIRMVMVWGGAPTKRVPGTASMKVDIMQLVRLGADHHGFHQGLNRGPSSKPHLLPGLP